MAHTSIEAAYYTRAGHRDRAQGRTRSDHTVAHLIDLAHGFLGRIHRRTSCAQDLFFGALRSGTMCSHLIDIRRADRMAATGRLGRVEEFVPLEIYAGMASWRSWTRGFLWGRKPDLLPHVARDGSARDDVAGNIRSQTDRGKPRPLNSSHQSHEGRRPIGDAAEAVGMYVCSSTTFYRGASR